MRLWQSLGMQMCFSGEEVGVLLIGKRILATLYVLCITYLCFSMKIVQCVVNTC